MTRSGVLLLRVWTEGTDDDPNAPIRVRVLSARPEEPVIDHLVVEGIEPALDLVRAWLVYLHVPTDAQEG